MGFATFVCPKLSRPNVRVAGTVPVAMPSVRIRSPHFTLCKIDTTAIQEPSLLPG